MFSDYKWSDSLSPLYCNQLTGLTLPRYGLYWLRTNTELVQNLRNDRLQLQGEVVEGLELEHQGHDRFPGRGLILRSRFSDGFAYLFRRTCFTDKKCSVKILTKIYNKY